MSTNSSDLHDNPDRPGTATPLPSRKRAMGRLVAALLPVLLAVVATGAPSGAQTAAPRSLKVGPAVYVAGQAVTFTGALGRAGRQPIHLQFNMNRPGDAWTDVDGFSSTTDGQGRFHFTHPAPAMFNISYRVVAPHAASPAWRFRARSQEVVLGVDALGLQLPANTAVAGRPFALTVDTTPALSGGGADLTPPAIPGRAVTLQERAGDGWRDVASGTTDTRGQASFDLDVSGTGVKVYRVREEDWLVDGNKIGWFPSFPTYVNVVSARSQRARAAAAERPAPAVQAAPVSARQAGASPTAGSAHLWGPFLYDFAWEYGESLTSPPHRGTRRRGEWRDTSTGSGRAVHYNGGLALQSQPRWAGAGDHGTTAVTLRDNALSSGRWEFRLRAAAHESLAADYRARIELVPTGAAGRACSADNITVADFTMSRGGMRVGVSSPQANASWSRTLSGVTLNDIPRNVAVEVAPDHISWFYNGRVIATVTDPDALGHGTLTPRISLIGDGDREMNATTMISDWQRAWTLQGGTQTTNGAGLARTGLRTDC